MALLSLIMKVQIPYYLNMLLSELRIIRIN